MRNLKKVLSLAMAMMMLVSIMSITAGAVSISDYTDKDKISHTTAVGLLSELNVIKGTDTGAFNPDGAVTRAAMAKMICVALNKGVDNGAAFVGAKASYKDTKGHWAEGYIEYCSALGIIAGDGSGKFNPDASVTGAQAAKMLLVAMGYDATKEGLVGSAWQLKTTVLASAEGLFDGISTVPSQVFDRDDAAQLIYNTLFAQTVGYSVATGALVKNTIGATTAASTIAYEKFNLTALTGVVKENDGGVLGSADAMSTTYTGKTKIDVATVNGVADTVGSAYDAYYSVASDASLLGKTVNVYIKGADVKKVYGKPVLSSVNKIVESKAVLKDGVVTVTGSLAKFAKDNGVTLNGSTVYITYSQSAASSTAFTSTSAGELLTLIDNNGDGYADYAIKTVPVAQAVTSVTTSTISGVTTTRYNGTTPLLTSANTNTVFAKGDVALFYAFNGKYVSEKATVVQGKVTNFTATGAVVNGTTYYSAANAIAAISGMTQNSAATYATTYNFFLDQAGYVVNIVAVASTASQNYAVLLDLAYVAGSGISGTDRNEAKILLTDGTTKVVSLYSLKADGGTVYGPSAAVTALGATKLDGDKSAGAIKTVFDADGNEFFTYTVNADGSYSLAYATATGSIAPNTAIAKTVVYDGANAADSQTIFLVKKTGSTDTYAAYVGYASVPAIAANKLTSGLRLDNETAPNGIDNIVYLIAPAADVGVSSTTLAYITSTAYSFNYVNGGTSYYTYPAIINGNVDVVKTTNKPFAATGLYSLTLNAAGLETTADNSAVAVTPNKITALGNGIISAGSAYVVNDSTVVYIIGTDNSVTKTTADALSVGTYVYIVPSVSASTVAGTIYAYPVVAGYASALSLAPAGVGGLTESSDLIVGTPATAAVYTGFAGATDKTITVSVTAPAGTGSDVTVALKSGPATYNATTGVLTITGTGTVKITVTTAELGKVDKTTDYTITIS